MIRAYQLKRRVTESGKLAVNKGIGKGHIESGQHKETTLLGGAIPVGFIKVQGEWFYSVLDYLDAFVETTRHRGKGVMRSYFIKHQKMVKKAGSGHAAGFGKVFATTRSVYGDIEYLTSITKALELVEDVGSAFSSNVKRPEYTEVVNKIFRGLLENRMPFVQPTVDFSMDDFEEVPYSDMRCYYRSSRMVEEAIPESHDEAKTADEGGLVKPSESQEMPEVIRHNHPIDRDTVRAETAAAAHITSRSKEDEDRLPKLVSELYPAANKLLNVLLGGRELRITITVSIPNK